MWLLFIAMIPGILKLSANDDVHLLQNPNPQLQSDEKLVRDVTGIPASGQFLLIEAKTEEDLLQSIEQLMQWAEQSGIANQLLAISQYVPSQQQQRQSWDLLHALSTDDHALPQWKNIIGFNGKKYDDYRAQLNQPPASFLTVNDLMNSPLQSMAKHFQWQKTDRGYICAIILRSTDGANKLRDYAQQHSSMYFIVPAEHLSNLFRECRQRSTVWVAVAYGLIALLFMWRYGRRTHRVLLPPALAAWVAIGLLGYAGVSLNLFHILGLFLILGVGIDYSIYFAETDDHCDTTLLGVCLSAIATLLSFGLLALSNTAAVSGFGWVVCLGIIGALLLSPLAWRARFAGGNGS